ncbi:DUF6716 putative glycosyltransferase [Humibacter ginsenosidimutans]|uniref:Uncharacterized protein n=1 Tax=Humibacter ginsenosidimutans TaxID=2599293 RepID=A0A5B8M5R7_9MICO|nr:DUF6716 putative glycosyltransferase [Humibacter ginsenosidimutans]QDZ14942.1 hypothetical protein FPZ11_09375 [Humibacter ginsenosidimutans]
MPRSIIGIVDSDSFVKWGASLLATMPAGWRSSLVAVNTAATASDGQLRSALGALPAVEGVRGGAGSIGDGTAPGVGEVERLSRPEIIERIRRERPDAVLVATRGPIAEVLIDEIHQRVPRRPVIVTGLPGISTPAKWKGLFLRARADLFVLHSHREIREYRALAASRGMTHRFGLSTLPFLHGRARGPIGGRRDRIVFAAQPTVPAGVEARRMLVSWLAETAAAHPHLEVVIKIRATTGEGQTHVERHPYRDLVPEDAPANLVVEGGSMAAQLDRAVGFVTVSSTAALEAIAHDVPSLVLADFGVSGKLINEVFMGSGLLGTSRDLVAGRFKQVVDGWREDNYFHPAVDDDWAHQLDMLVALRETARLPERPAVRVSRGGSLRRAWERKRAFGRHDHSAIGYVALAVGTPLRAARNAAFAALPNVSREEPVDVLVEQPEALRSAADALSQAATPAS